MAKKTIQTTAVEDYVLGMLLLGPLSMAGLKTSQLNAVANLTRKGLARWNTPPATLQYTITEEGVKHYQHQTKRLAERAGR